MELNREENVCCDMKFDDGCFMGKYPDVEREDFVEFDDSESDVCCEDIADLLPNDPFGMEFNIGLAIDPFVMGIEISLPRDPFGMDLDIEANLMAIPSLIEVNVFEADEASQDKNNDDNKIVTGLNFYWTSCMKYEQEEEDNEIVDAVLWAYLEDRSNENHDMLGGDVDDLVCLGCEKYENSNAEVDNDGDGGEPADALFFAVGYLGIKDLLSVEMACKSLRDAVRDDISVWKNIHIDYPLSNKITDDGLLQLTKRAKGNLCSLSLMKCVKITNTGLKHVLESNPRLTKLSVQGCIKLSIEDILHDLKIFNSVGKPGIKRLRIGDRSGLTNQQYKEFMLLLGVNEDKRKTSNYKPRFRREGELYLSLDDERAIDIETCPRCQQARQVFDCPSESCQEKIHSTKACRGCYLCISRCISCGCCLDNKPYEETFCFELLCLDCLGQLFNRTKASYHILLCG